MAEEPSAALPRGLAVERGQPGSAGVPAESDDAENADGADGGLAAALTRPYDTTPPPEPEIEPLLRRLKHRNPKSDLATVRRAWEVARAKHDGQLRSSGEPFIAHPLNVANIVADLGMDATSVVAALLHDTVEDTSMTLDEVEELFGEEIARITDGLTKLERMGFETREAAQAETIRKMVIAMARDIRVLVIKLADRLSNMRDVGYKPRESRERTARETWLTDTIDQINAQLKAVKLRAEVTGRPKHYYSIYEKMVVRGKEFSDIFDLVGVRVLVDSIKDCYAALGQVHALWKPVPGRFKDYIAMPKFNLYQSLHTTVVGPGGKPLEVQIRTKAMHQTAEYGIAAHWRYKDKGKDGRAATDQEMGWLRQLIDWQRELSDPKDFIDNLKTDLYVDEVFVFTPKGDVFQLPAGAT